MRMATIECPICGEKFSTRGIGPHARVIHPEAYAKYKGTKVEHWKALIERDNQCLELSKEAKKEKAISTKALSYNEMRDIAIKFFPTDPLGFNLMFSVLSISNGVFAELNAKNAITYLEWILEREQTEEEE